MDLVKLMIDGFSNIVPIKRFCKLKNAMLNPITACQVFVVITSVLKYV